MEESDDISFINHSAENNHHVTETTTVINKEEGGIINNDAFAFETFLKEDNLNDWLFRAENSSFVKNPIKTPQKRVILKKLD